MALRCYLKAEIEKWLWAVVGRGAELWGGTVAQGSAIPCGSPGAPRRIRFTSAPPRPRHTHSASAERDVALSPQPRGLRSTHSAFRARRVFPVLLLNSARLGCPPRCPRSPEELITPSKETRPPRLTRHVPAHPSARARLRAGAACVRACVRARGRLTPFSSRPATPARGGTFPAIGSVAASRAHLCAAPQPVESGRGNPVRGVPPSWIRGDGGAVEPAEQSLRERRSEVGTRPGRCSAHAERSSARRATGLQSHAARRRVSRAQVRRSWGRAAQCTGPRGTAGRQRGPARLRVLPSATQPGPRCPGHRHSGRCRPPFGRAARGGGPWGGEAVRRAGRSGAGPLCAAGRLPPVYRHRRALKHVDVCEGVCGSVIAAVCRCVLLYNVADLRCYICLFLSRPALLSWTSIEKQLSGCGWSESMPLPIWGGDGSVLCSASFC